jgi:hypothetical protein
MPPIVEQILTTDIEGIFKGWESSQDQQSYFKLWQNSGPQINHHFGVCLRDGARCAYFYDSPTWARQGSTEFPDSLEFVPQENRHHLIRCREVRFHNEFNQIIKEWALRADGSAHPIDALSDVIADWNIFLSRKDSMSRAKVVGLFGELDFLEKTLDGADAGGIEQWLGCQQGTIDFRNRNKAVEVKASTVRDSHKVTFHGLDQLLLRDGEEARIVFYRLEEIDKASEENPSIATLTDRIRKKIINFPRAVEVFNRKLDEAGLDSPALAEFGDTGFRVLARKACLVDDRIPRVTRAMFGDNAAMIVSIEYSVELSGVLQESLFQPTVDWFRKNPEGAP